MLGITGGAIGAGQQAFDGPVPGNVTEPAQLARA
jgi:hypothetical protein